jgi:hypothetical protein
MIYSIRGGLVAPHRPRVTFRGSRGNDASKNCAVIDGASFPDIRTIPNALRPIGVANATIVSSAETTLCRPSRIGYSMGLFLAARSGFGVSWLQYFLMNHC